MKLVSATTNGRRMATATLLAMTCALAAHAAAPQDLVAPCDPFDYSYALQAGQAVPASPPAEIAAEVVGNSSALVTWTVANDAVAPCTVLTPTTWSCAGMTITHPATGSPVAQSLKATVTGTGAATLQEGKLHFTVVGNDILASTCNGNILFHTTASGGGWGDPHLTTVDGVHYDFQSAGEFTTLRDEHLEVQARQSPVPTASVPITNPYTGLTHCVAIYTAVATKLGSTRVTLQPPKNPGTDPNAEGMQLRVNGELVTLGETPLILRAKSDDPNKPGKVDGTVTQHPDGVIEFTDARGTQVVVTPQYWESQHRWYLNLNVYGTSAHRGTIGSIAEGSWLPALPDGSSVGERPEGSDDRYQALYEKFADAWRVTDKTSLFDYEPGTSTATFTLDEWPRNNPESCSLEGETSVEPTTEEAAQQACANVTDATQKTDCAFDVMITGNTGFAKGYEVMQKFKPRGAGFYLPEPRSEGGQPPPCTGWHCWPWWYWVLIAVAILILLLILRGVFKKAPGP